MSSATATKEFPLTTTSNLRGTWYMLVWHTENTGNHIIVAKTKESIIKTWPIFINRLDPDPKEFWQISICDPGKDVHEEFAKIKYEEALSNFTFRMQQLLRNAKEMKKATGDFIRCKKYVSKYADDPDYEIDEYMDKLNHKQHYDCKNCVYGGFNHRTLTPEELFWAKKDLLMEKPLGFPVTPDVSNALDPDTVYAVEEDYGHHSKGLFVQHLKDHFAGRQTKFFFTGEPLPMPVEILKATVDTRKKWEQKRKESAKKYEADNKKYYDNEYAKLLEILK